MDGTRYQIAPDLMFRTKNVVVPLPCYSPQNKTEKSLSSASYSPILLNGIQALNG